MAFAGDFAEGDVWWNSLRTLLESDVWWHSRRTLLESDAWRHLFGILANFIEFGTFALGFTRF